MSDGKTLPDDCSGLKESAQTKAEIDAYEFGNITKATQKYLLSLPTSKKAPFTYEWFLKLHKEMLGEVWEWAGQIRHKNMNIGVPKEQVREQLKILERDYQFWLSSKSQIASEEICARLHHRAVWIHPFKNGNGRWARLLTNIHRRQQKLPLLKWPEQQLIEQGDMRARYLTALREADQQKFHLLVILHQEWL